MEDDASDNIVMAVKLRSATRQGYMLSGFIGYHLVKTILWRYGYFAHFFYRTRFMSIPVLLYGIYWNTKKTMLDLNEAGVLNYTKRRLKFDRD